MDADGLIRDVVGISVGADGAIFGVSGTLPLIRSEADSITLINDVMAEDATTASKNETDGQAAEIQVLLSPVTQSMPLESGATVSQLLARAASVNSSGQAVPASIVRTKAGPQSTGMALQPGQEKTDTDAHVSGEMELIGPTSLELENRGPSTASLPVKDQGLTSLLASDVKVVVLQTETHHAPVLFGGPIAQILDGIRAELTDGEIWPNGPTVDPAAAKLGSDAPVRTLLIQLQPADLGTVTVKMSLKDDALELHIEASQHETAQRLHQDQETLLKALRTAGYLVDGATVRIVEADKMVTLPGNAGGQGLGTPSQSSYHGSQSGAPSGGGTPQERGQQEHAARGSSDRNATGGADGDRGRSAGGLYV
jgi:hypothetical protein